MPQYTLKLNCRDNSYLDMVNGSTRETVDQYCFRRVSEFLCPKKGQEILQVYFLMGDEIKDRISENGFDLYTASFARNYDYNDCFAVRCYIVCKDKIEANTLKIMFGEYILK